MFEVQRENWNLLYDCFQAGTAGLCLCQSKKNIYMKAETVSTSNGPLLCQAIDSLEGRLVGCCNPVSIEESGNIRLCRPGSRVPFMMMCDVHQQRILRHNCCPGCGNFCTQVSMANFSTKPHLKVSKAAFTITKPHRDTRRLGPNRS